MFAASKYGEKVLGIRALKKKGLLLKVYDKLVDRIVTLDSRFEQFKKMNCQEVIVVSDDAKEPEGNFDCYANIMIGNCSIHLFFVFF